MGWFSKKKKVEVEPTRLTIEQRFRLVEDIFIKSNNLCVKMHAYVVMNKLNAERKAAK